MTAAEFSALMLLSAATSFTPGPNTTLSTALAANFGLRRAMRFVCAVPVGWGLLFTLCAVGLGSLVVAQPALRWGILVAALATCCGWPGGWRAAAHWHRSMHRG
jgi:threonine/homoserine/homoserine lactone efflux protein